MDKWIKEYKEILNKIIDILVKEYEPDDFLDNVRFLLSQEIEVKDIKRILYGIISFYLINEIALQPVEKKNFIDMGSYYFRSESYNIDFPDEYHSKYNIPIKHLDRKSSLFFSNRNFIENYLKEVPIEKLGNVELVIKEDPDLKMPVSRQVFLIEYFLLFPKKFYDYFISKYDSSFKNSGIFKLRLNKKYEQFISIRLTDFNYEKEINEKLSNIVGSSEDYILTSSGTAANQLTIEYLNNSNNRSFFHKYWYYENLGENQSHYFYEIKNKEIEFDNFYINIKPTNFVDIENPGFIEDIEKEVNKLIIRLGSLNKNFNLIIDITSNPFFEIKDGAKNINIIKTLSLSKYQEGINTNFAGIVIADPKNILGMNMVAEKLGFKINELDKRFLLLPNFSEYKVRIKKINEITRTRLESYKSWSIIPVGLSVVLVPPKDVIDFQLRKFSNQTQVTDRKFAWILRDRVNELILKSNLTDMFIGDSFLFPTSRINMQGQVINAKDYSTNNHKFKYRLPRISPGYNTRHDINTYYEFYKNIIDIYTEEYKKL